MFTRIINYPKSKSFFLLGPRGTGKSTWIKHTFPNALWFDLLESEHVLQLQANPQNLDRLIPEGWGDWIVIDEIQRVPELLHEVHRLIEKRKLKFALTGSSARSLRRSGVNLLGGRAQCLHMFPLTARELKNSFDLAKSLKCGQLPLAQTSDRAQDFLSAYIQLYLREEVQFEGLTRNLSAFARFLETASFSQASLLNVSNVAKECHIERKTVENYFTILEDLLLAKRLQVFTKRAHRHVVSHSKFYFFDVGVFRTLRPQGPLDITSELEGAALETLVYQELQAFLTQEGFDAQLYFWRTTSGLEVDFVVYGAEGLWAIEVKRSDRLKNEDFRGLQAFGEEFSVAKKLLLHMGSKNWHENGTECVAVDCFLKNITTYFNHKNTTPS